MATTRKAAWSTIIAATIESTVVQTKIVVRNGGFPGSSMGRSRRSSAWAGLYDEDRRIQGVEESCGTHWSSSAQSDGRAEGHPSSGHASEQGGQRCPPETSGR